MSHHSPYLVRKLMILQLRITFRPQDEGQLEWMLDDLEFIMEDLSGLALNDLKLVDIPLPTT
jgi:hypothetical protein